MELSGLTAEIDALVAAGPFAFGDGAQLLELRRQITRLESLYSAAVGEFDTAGSWPVDGATSAAAWIAARANVPAGVARREVSRSRKLRRLHRVGAAWSDGDITSSHVETLLSLHTPRLEGALHEAEETLVKWAKDMRFLDFSRATAYWAQAADPDGAEESDMEKKARRDVFLTASMDGMMLGQMTLDPISGAIVTGELERLEQQLFDEDWKEASERLDRTPRLEELARTTGQRRCDALVEMATRSGTAPANGRRPAPLFTVFVGYETLQGRILELADGTPLAPGSLLDWLDRAYIERAVFSLPDRVDVSASARFFTGATRRAMDLRDRRCQHPFCDRPARWCQGDHIEEWSKGGKTTLENGRLLCGYHNRLRNQAPPPRRE